MIEPFLKWPGGKRWLTSRYRSLFPNEYCRYIEPFLGGGAVFFSLDAKAATLSDTNRELINVYRCIKRDFREVEAGLAWYQRRHSESFYYQVRDREPKETIARAVRFLYLNRTCFNGMYRVNLQGVFNVPIGTKKIVTYDPGYLEQVAERLKKARIRNVDFECAIREAEANDFVFIDPPYTVMHNNNGFVKYNAKLFSWEDQARLAVAVRAASDRGVKIMLSNADHKSVKALYTGFGIHRSVKRLSVLSGKAEKRGEASELLITNF
jgi:DNA adenine methylase